ncbi:hypothetical protein ACOJR9_02290 [Alteromonas sp. A081]|uniref:hypothetical protein n=1 Tax=Alteromonas sp. A081 TaxID=3410269 RepID=UPI003B982ACF
MKSRAITLISLLAALGIFSVQAESIGKAIEKCRSTEDSLKRLMCFDRMAKSISQYNDVDMQISDVQAIPKANPKSPTATKVPAVSPSAAAAPHKMEEIDPKASFGLSKKRTPVDEVSEVALTIAELSKGIRGEQVITFSNGSQWQQVDTAFLKLETGQSVTIEKGLFGTFFLGVEGLNTRLKVKRLK